LKTSSQNKPCTVASVVAPVARAGPRCAAHVAPSRYSGVRTHCTRRCGLVDGPWTLRPTPGHTPHPPRGSRAGATRQVLQPPVSRRSRGLPGADGLKGDETSTPMFLSFSTSPSSTGSFSSAQSNTAARQSTAGARGVTAPLLGFWSSCCPFPFAVAQLLGHPVLRPCFCVSRPRRLSPEQNRSRGRRPRRRLEPPPAPSPIRSTLKTEP
jgi:hypothetical protein